jgi:TP901 family phage tail tape measure protein
MGKRFLVSTIFKGIDQMSAPLARIQNRVASMTRSLDKHVRRVQRTTERAVNGMKNLGRNALVVGAIATAGLGQAAAAGINFEQSVVNASAKFGEMSKRGTKSFESIQSAAAGVGATTEFTATQAAEALNFLAMAGFNADQSIAALPGVVDLATAAQVDLALATDIATDTLGAFGLESKNAVQQAKNLSRVNDVLARTANTSNTSMVQLFNAMKKGGPIATTTGADIETVAAMIGTMANAGIKAELAGTAVANSFLNLSSPTSTAQKVMRRLGIEVKDLATGSLKDMPDLIDELNNKTKNLTKTQRLGALEAIFGREGLAGTAKVVSQGGDALRVYRERLRGANGAASDMAKTMRDTTQGSLNSLKSAVEGVSIALFETNRGPMRRAIDLATEWTRANSDLIAQNIGGFFLDIAENFGVYLERAKMVAGVVAVIWGLNTALKAVAAATWLVNAAMAANPFVLLIGAFVTLVALSNKFQENLSKMPDAVQKAFHGTALGSFADSLYILRNLKMPSIFGDDTGAAGTDPTVSSPQERTATSMSETLSRSINEVLIKDETGRAEVRNIKGPQQLTVAATGGF